MKTVKTVLASILAIITAASLTGCGVRHDSVVDITVDVVTPAPVTEAPTEIPTETPEVTETPTPEPDITDVPTDRPDVTAPPSDQSVFDDAAFIGNSFFVGLYRYGVVTHGRFFTKVGLNVSTVFTDPADEGSVPVIEELTNSEFKKVIIYLGTNELGWPNLNVFIQKYSGLLDAVWERIPEAEIFIVGILPVTKAYSDGKGRQDGINNENIANMNAALEALANERGAHFIDVPEEMYDSDSALPANATTEGIHPNLAYDRIWAAHILMRVTEAQ